jgi:hypothetical protein
MSVTLLVRPYTRRGRRVSGYRRQRFAVMRMLAARQGLTERQLLLSLHGDDPLQIAHVASDAFSSYDARSTGTKYARWMAHVRAHPENYRLLRKSQNWKEYAT